MSETGTSMSSETQFPVGNTAGAHPAAEGLHVHGAMVELGELAKRFGDTWAVQRISLRLEAGEFVTLLGESGSGKTTTLLMVAGFETPTTGTIKFDGQVVTSLPAHKRNIGMVFQSYALFPHKTVFDNIAFPLRRRRLASREVGRRVSDALALVHLAGMERRYPRELSGGQQQRIAVARATVYQPRLLLMDEPLSALDKNLRTELQGEVRRIHQGLGTTVLYVTHDQEEAMALSDRIVLMRDGGIEQEGRPDDIYDRPKTAFAAGFLGEANMLRGRIRGSGADGTAVVELTDGTRVSGVRTAPMRDGDPALVVVRPERLEVRAEAAEGCLQVVLKEATFLGQCVRCVGEFATGESSMLRLDPATAGAVMTGRIAHVRWPTQAATVIPADTLGESRPGNDLP